ncbi:hypothetical protein HGRIS_004557 [Hohenbuehelia grisea]|uniref:Aminotransferase class V domain-containing protein n=1 Tax=Hohenbuehelia grisea TaxID=104357 RepID=A0ABR3JCZ8_9AGAR
MATQSTPIEFGHSILPFFSFGKKYINLNNGSFGSMPKPVARFCQELSERVEANPDRYHRVEFPSLLGSARERIAHMIGAETDECVFVSSTTAGMNTILRNLTWEEGDVLLGFSTTYRGVERVMRYIADTTSATLVIQDIHFPTSHKIILRDFRALIQSTKAKQNEYYLRTGIERRPQAVAVIDAIVSQPGIYMPWKEMVEICAEEGVYSVVDAAHSIGQEVNINLSQTNPDFWVSNCHKWLFAKRGSTILYVPKRNQHLIRSSLVTSWDYVSPSESSESSFVIQHEWPGAIDFAPYLSVEAAIDFRNLLGGEEAINTYCRDLALRGGKRLAEILRTRLFDESDNRQMTLNMVNVELPLSMTPLPQIQDKINTFFEEKLLYDYNISVVTFYMWNRWWVRCSAQVWNELSDFDQLGKALTELCIEATRSILLPEEC